MHMVEGRWGIRPPRAAREKSGTTSQRPSFRIGTGKLASSMLVNATKIASGIMKAVQLSTRSLRRHVTMQAPSTPSVTNNVLTLTHVTNARKVQTCRNGSPNQDESTSRQPSGPNHAKPTKNQRHGNREKKTTSSHETFASENNSHKLHAPKPRTF